MKHNQMIAQIGWGAALVGSVVLMASCFSPWPNESTQDPSPYLTVTRVGGSYGFAVPVGDTIRLTVVARDGWGQLMAPPAVTWSTSSPAFATVDPSGLVTGVGEGAAMISATADKMVGRTSIQVTLPFTRVGILPGTTEVVAGGVASFQAFPQDSLGRQVGYVRMQAQWSVEDTTVARIDAAGTLTGLSAGNTTVRATLDGRAGSAPVSVITVAYAAVVTGDGQTCGLTVENKAYCWGSVVDHGSPAARARLSPVRLSPDTQFTSLSAGGSATCGITRGMQAFCWVGSSYQTLVRGAFRLVANGLSHNCGLSDSPDPGRAYCWGSSDRQQLGTDAPDLCGGYKSGPGYPCANNPVLVSGSPVLTSLDAGEAHTCGLTAGGLAYCWGDNRSGQLGDPAYTDSSRGVPAPVADSIRFASLTAGDHHTCGIDRGGHAYCWGSNQFGELGIGDAASALVRRPQPIASPLTFRSISAGGKHTCAISTANTVYCWGSNAFGQLGDGTSSGSPRPVPVLQNLAFQQISGGSAHTCGRSVAGLLYCWGSNDLGALGTADFVSHTQPVLVVGQRAPQ